MTARDVLAEIEQRTENALRPGTSVYRALDKTVIDNRALVAALRAVLDLHGEVDAPWCECLSSHCKCGNIWPCIDLAEVSETITDALNGVTAGTDR